MPLEAGMVIGDIKEKWARLHYWLNWYRGAITSRVIFHTLTITHGRGYAAEYLKNRVGAKKDKQAESRKDPSDPFNLMLGRIEDIALYYRKDYTQWTTYKRLKEIQKRPVPDAWTDMLMVLVQADSASVFIQYIAENQDLEDRHFDFYGEYKPINTILWERNPTYVNGEFRVLDGQGQLIEITKES